MILSHKHKFIFLKTNKTGGTSVEIALSRYCGPDDVIAPIAPEDEAIRRSLGYPGPQHHVFPLSRYRGRHWRLALEKGKRLKYYNHMPAREIRLLAGEEVWHSYYKFCFERNPWERVVSLYYWRHPREPRPAFEEFVGSDVVLNLRRKGSDLYTENGRIVVDRVCRYEDFGEELRGVAEHLVLPGPLDPPRAKGANRPRDNGATPHFSASSGARMGDLFSFEIERFGYQPPRQG